MTYSFNGLTKIITPLEAPVNSAITIDVQEIYSRWIDWFLTSDNSKFLMAMRAVGGDPLPGSKSLGLTYFLLNGWKIKPYEADHTFTLNGNLYSEDGSTPFVSTTGAYNVAVISSVSNLVDSTVQQLQEIAAIRFQVESLRDTHQGFGTVFYYDPVNGDDGLDGLYINTPKLTFASALSECVSGRGDVIYIIAPGEAQVSIDDRWVINKASVYVRGPGRGVILKPVGAGGGAPTISIEADEVSLSGFIVEASTADATSANAIDVWGRFSRIEKMWINRAKNGIRYCAGDYHKMRSCEIELHAENGILVHDVRFGTAFAGNGAPREIEIDNVPNIYLNTQNGIKLVADTVNYSAGESTRLIRIFDSNIQLNTLYGLDIGTGVYRTLIRSSVSFNNNTSGNILDNGTQTHDSTETALIWDEAIADHLTAGTTGKALSDAGSAGNPWGSPITGNTNAGTFGELVGKKLLTVAKFLGLK